MDLPDAAASLERVSIALPPSALKDSLWLQAAASGDLMGPSLEGIGSLLQMPSGCGEQNMINFAPNTFILKYLRTRNLLTDQIRTRSEGMMSAGYQRELSYQRSDGSFSAFGNSDTSGSLWLTAFVLKCLLQARGLTYIDSTATSRAALWLWSLRDTETNLLTFREPGRILNTELQSGSGSSSTALAAYVLSALLENPDDTGTPDSTGSAGPVPVQWGLQFTAEQVGGLRRVLDGFEGPIGAGTLSAYQLSLVAFAAVSLCRHPKFSAADKAKATSILNAALDKLKRLETGISEMKCISLK